MDLFTIDSLILLISAFVAGLVDAIVGGGGLIQLPAMMVYLPKEEMATVLGTNKFASFSGTSVSGIRFALRTKINWKATLPAIIFAIPFSFLGAFLVSQLSKEILKPLMLALFLLVGLYTFFNRDFGNVSSQQPNLKKQLFYSCLIGALIGFYDGFFGPGTGSFLVFLYVAIFGFSFLQASASAKIVNMVTNFSALIYFFHNKQILFSVAIPVALSNIAGSFIGTNFAIKKGSSFVRIIFLLIVSGFIIKLAGEIFMA